MDCVSTLAGIKVLQTSNAIVPTVKKTFKLPINYGVVHQSVVVFYFDFYDEIFASTLAKGIKVRAA